MNSLLETHAKNGELNHGYLLIGDFAAARAAARAAAAVLLGREEGKLESCPDFSHQKFDLFGIKESHELKSRSLLRPFSGDKKVFIIELFSLTMESANALLKLFEEPPEGTHFFIAVPSEDAVIPTLRSRLTAVEFQKKEEENAACEEFLKTMPNKRMDMIKKIGKDKNAAIEFLNGLEAIMAKKLEKSVAENSPKTDAQAGALEELGKSREFLAARGSSVKMVLEHLALIL
ncbi:MAG: hypothetical protein GXP44_02415 [bacterium]|nr:hypothetical protein [bacterium]